MNARTRAVRPRAVALVHEAIVAAREHLQEALHALDEAAVLDDDGRLTLGALDDDLGRAEASIATARKYLVELRLFLLHEAARVERLEKMVEEGPGVEGENPDAVGAESKEGA